MVDYYVVAVSYCSGLHSTKSWAKNYTECGLLKIILKVQNNRSEINIYLFE